MQPTAEKPIAPGASSVLEGMLCRQVKVGEAIYRETCTRLCDAIDGENYFCGSVAFPAAGIDCRLTVAVIVYRREVSCPEGTDFEICDLIPVWWEFHTSVDGDELPNDFKFGELKNHL